MKDSDKYLKVVRWSEEDQVYIGRCPQIIHGGIHGDDEVEVNTDLCALVEETVNDMLRDGFKLPEPALDELMKLLEDR